ncbi:hypothetical protein FOYG_17269 [Fusarium oxysporum NRRL 32931]|uniref:Uncharacterized protein n=1 Tax=Fusarium oxysporum NRRL 32931 TaxID=660029 RepID=W9HF22_FUSOX|nr:hypothetical protein FOYG_17269 [Fusarium oxysporum NRRL 32931]
MPEKDIIRVPQEEIRRTLEALDGRRVRKDLVNVSPDEVRRTLADIDRRRAEERAIQRERASQRAAIQAELRERQLTESSQERSDEFQAPSHSATATETRSRLVTVSPEEMRRTLEGLARQRKEERIRQRAANAARAPRSPTPDQIQPSPQTPSSTARVSRPARPNQIQRPPRTPSSKRPREGEGLLTPPSTRPDRRSKRPRPLGDVKGLQRKSIDSILQHYESCFRDKEEASVSRSWCKEVPLAAQVEAAKSFYQAFTDEKTLPISHCVFCYKKQAPGELARIQWKSLLATPLVQATRALQLCAKCLPQDGEGGVDVCRECRAGLQNGRLPKACSVNNMHIGCEHRYPKELDDLSPVEERLIALHAPFGYITKFTVDNKAPSGLKYRKHVKGHIVVFPNKVDDLVATVLPHPLLEAIENIHVSWSGSSKPNPTDVGHLLQVRKTIVRKALVWLQKNNPLYEHVAINHSEIDCWQYEGTSNIPTVIFEMMGREEPSIAEKTQTDHIVPATDRGLPENQSTSIEELLNSVRVDPGEERHPPGELSASVLDKDQTDANGDVVYETSSSGMFPLDEPATFSEADKLSFLADAMQTDRSRGNDVPQPCGMNMETTEEQPFIRVERGSGFADNLHEDFFPRTFPKLFPWGKGGPKATTDTESRQQRASEPVHNPPSNHSLTYWAKYVLQRHGGRFATHPVFCFLVFNILLRSSNRRISMVRMTKNSFNRAEQVYQSLTADQLRRAEEEMRQNKTTTDDDVSFLLRELSIFGHAQPLSNETRLLMRRKIQSLIVWAGTPVIWFTINPNDINNPVKMRLSIHRLHDYDMAKELLADLQGRYDRIALSTLDPVSSVIFFHREISLFFDNYVKDPR